MNSFKRSFVKKVFLGLFCVLFFLGSAVPALSAPKKPKKDKKNSTSVDETVTEAATESPTENDVDVYAEGAYTTGNDGNLTVYIYANINVGDLCSYGVKLNYDIDKLENPVAEKNETVWFMGDGTEAGNKTYMDPDTSTAGEIIFIGGKLDEADPTAGVTGTRKLLGKVTFSRTSGTKTEDPTDDGVGGTQDPKDYFEITLELGRPDPDYPTITFDNFVTAGGTVKDDSGVNFNAPTIRERGDANADGYITNMDMFEVKNMLTSSDFVVYADCNDDKYITNMDMFCIKGKL
jgi:hypothetical protein